MSLHPPTHKDYSEAQEVKITPEMLVDEVVTRLGEWFGPLSEGRLTLKGLRVVAADVVEIISRRAG